MRRIGNNGDPSALWMSPTKSAPSAAPIAAPTIGPPKPTVAPWIRNTRWTVAPDAPIAQIIEPLGMPPKLVHLVLVNGVYIPPEQRATRTFAEGDVLAIWPPIAGG